MYSAGKELCFHLFQIGRERDSQNWNYNKSYLVIVAISKHSSWSIVKKSTLMDTLQKNPFFGSPQAMLLAALVPALQTASHQPSQSPWTSSSRQRQAQEQEVCFIISLLFPSHAHVLQEPVCSPTAPSQPPRDKPWRWQKLISHKEQALQFLAVKLVLTCNSLISSPCSSARGMHGHKSACLLIPPHRV